MSARSHQFWNMLVAASARKLVKISGRWRWKNAFMSIGPSSFGRSEILNERRGEPDRDSAASHSFRTERDHTPIQFSKRIRSALNIHTICSHETRTRSRAHSSSVALVSRWLIASERTTEEW
jgi:hypothetical protein